MFKSMLTEIVTSCDGAVGALLMGFDGIEIDNYCVDDNLLDLNLVGIEYSNVIKEIRIAADVLSIGDLEEVSIKTDRHYVVIRALTVEYFVALLINRDGNYGQGRYLLMRDSAKICQELR